VRGLPVGAKLPADQDTTDVEDLRVAIDVTSFEREQLRRP
jgi:hypothetical protein